MRIAEKLRSIKGRFIVSLNDRSEVREIFEGFRILAVPLTYTISGGEGKQVTELIITSERDADNVNPPV